MRCLHCSAHLVWWILRPRRVAKLFPQLHAVARGIAGSLSEESSFGALSSPPDRAPWEHALVSFSVMVVIPSLRLSPASPGCRRPLPVVTRSFSGCHLAFQGVLEFIVDTYSMSTAARHHPSSAVNRRLWQFRWLLTGLQSPAPPAADAAWVMPKSVLSLSSS